MLRSFSFDSENSGSRKKLRNRPLIPLQELAVEAAERQRVRNYVREPHWGWFRVLKRLLAASEVGSDLRAGRSKEADS